MHSAWRFPHKNNVYKAISRPDKHGKWISIVLKLAIPYMDQFFCVPVWPIGLKGNALNQEDLDLNIAAPKLFFQ